MWSIPTFWPKGNTTVLVSPFCLVMLHQFQFLFFIFLLQKWSRCVKRPISQQWIIHFKIGAVTNQISEEDIATTLSIPPWVFYTGTISSKDQWMHSVNLQDMEHALILSLVSNVRKNPEASKDAPSSILPAPSSRPSVTVLWAAASDEGVRNKQVPQWRPKMRPDRGSNIPGTNDWSLKILPLFFSILDPRR